MESSSQNDLLETQNPNQEQNQVVDIPSSSEEESEEEEETMKNNKAVKEAVEDGTQVPTAFPANRVKKVMKSDGDLRATAEAHFLFNKCAEKFVEQFVEDSCANMPKGERKKFTYNYLSSTVAAKKRYEFLADFVPQKIKAADALAQRASSED